MTTDPKILSITGRGVTVPGDDIDTDRIMPARYLRCVTFDQLGAYAFYDERFNAQGQPKPHPLNDPQFKGASILFVHRNFGCGSSREHAPQGLLRYGFKALIGLTFAEIFAGNCAAIGLPAFIAEESALASLSQMCARHPETVFTVDVDSLTVSAGGERFPLKLKEADRRLFLDGTWDTTATLLSARRDIINTAGRLPYLHWPVLGA